MVDGKISEAKYTEVKWLRFTKQLSSRPSERPNTLVTPPKQLQRDKEHTVFVVSAPAINEFLHQFEIDEASVRYAVEGIIG
jgi:hypothetical protein